MCKLGLHCRTDTERQTTIHNHTRANLESIGPKKQVFGRNSEYPGRGDAGTERTRKLRAGGFTGQPQWLAMSHSSCEVTTLITSKNANFVNIAT